jgi:hypothetical protein
MTCTDFGKTSYDYRDGAPDLSDRGRFYNLNQRDRKAFGPPKAATRKFGTKELRYVQFNDHPWYSYNKNVRRDMRASSAAELYGAERHQKTEHHPVRVVFEPVEEPTSDATTQVPVVPPERYRTEYTDSFRNGLGVTVIN